MSDWTDTATLIAALAAGKAFTDEKAQALAENAAALGEGAATLHSAGQAIRAAAMRGIVAGANVTKTIIGTRQVVLTQTNAGNGAFTAVTALTLASLTALRDGSVRVSAELKRSLTGGSTVGNAVVKVYKNGTLALTLSGTTNAFVAYTGDISFVAGDVLDFEILLDGSTGAGGGSNTGTFRLLRLLADIPSFWNM